jgi:hypothetical protein
VEFASHSAGLLVEVRREPVVLTSLYSLRRFITLLAVLSLTAVAISVLLVSLVHA